MDKFSHFSYLTSTYKKKIYIYIYGERERDLKQMAQLLNTLHNQVFMTQNFPTFHNANNCGINSVSPVLVNIFNFRPPLIHKWGSYLQLKIFKKFFHFNTKETIKKRVFSFFLFISLFFWGGGGVEAVGSD